MRPSQEDVAQHDADQNEDRRRRRARDVERRAGRGQRQAPAVEIVEAETDQDDRCRSQHDADEIDLHFGAAPIRLEPEAQQKHDRGHHDQNSEGRAPADIGAEHATDHEGQNARAGARRAQRAQRRGLLLALVILGDQRHQRRHDHGAGRAAEGLSRDHHVRSRAEGHQHLRAAEHDHRHAEYVDRAITLGQLRAEHDEAGHQHRIGDDPGRDRRRRHVEALDHAAHRDRQRGHVEGHDHLAECDGDHRHPGFLGLCWMCGRRYGRHDVPLPEGSIL